MSLLDRSYGIARSMLMYYGQPWRWSRMRGFYRQFMDPGDLCFDVGSHVGNRVGCWLSLGARVVAVEPQPDFHRLLQLFYGWHKSVTILDTGVASQAGTMTFHASSRTPTCSTISSEWMDEVQEDPRFRVIDWDREFQVETTTLDEMVERYGQPVFCKVDVEGLEEEVLKGLTRPVKTLSFEYIPVASDAAAACVRRMSELGDYRFRYSKRETMSWAIDEWLRADDIIDEISSLAMDDSSGDVYCSLQR